MQKNSIHRKKAKEELFKLRREKESDACDFIILLLLRLKPSWKKFLLYNIVTPCIILDNRII
jgi:hypothetical protein